MPSIRSPQIRQGLDRDLERFQRPQNRADRDRLGVWNGQQHLVRVVTLQDFGQLRARAEDRHAMDPMTDLRRVVVHESDRLVRE